MFTLFRLSQEQLGPQGKEKLQRRHHITSSLTIMSEAEPLGPWPQKRLWMITQTRAYWHFSGHQTVFFLKKGLLQNSPKLSFHVVCCFYRLIMCSPIWNLCRVVCWDRSRVQHHSGSARSSIDARLKSDNNTLPGSLKFFFFFTLSLNPQTISDAVC